MSLFKEKSFVLLIDLSKRFLLVIIHGQRKFFVSRSFFSLDEILKIKICHMLAKEHPDVIQGRRWLIAVYFPDSE